MTSSNNTTKVYYAGIDLHKRYSYITVTDGYDNKILETKVNNNTFAIQKALLQLNVPIKAAVEATFNSYWLVDTLKSVNIDTVVTHPTRLKAIGSSKIKTDKIDAGIIAKLHSHNMLPLSYIPTAEEQRLKDIVRLRLDLVQNRSRIKTKLKFFLLRNCIYDFPYTNIFGKKGQKWLKSIQILRPHEKDSINQLLDLINYFSDKIDELDELIKELSDQNYQAKLLQSIPGIGPILSLTLIAEIGNIERFKSSAHLCSYAGIVPSTYSSGGKTTHGNVTKTGSRLIRYALGEAIIHTTKSNEFLKKFYEQKSKEKCTSKAKVACMKKLLSYVYIMLKHNISFDKLEINRNSVDVEKS